MDQQDIDVMRDNVLVKKYPWAVALYQRAKDCSKTGSFDTTTYKCGYHMLGCALVYLIDGDTTYADGAITWLKAFATQNWNPHVDADFTQIHGLVSITYDLLYNYMAARRPSDLTFITKWLETYATRCSGNFGHNQNHQEQYGKAMAGYALGRTVYIDKIATDFKKWYDGTGQVFDGFHYEEGQAMKHWAIVFEGQVYYALASHRAAKRGYHSFDALTYISAQGKNLLRDNWRMMLKKSTPRFQVPYESMWRGMLFDWSNCTGTHQSIYAATGDPEWAAIVQQHPARDLDFPYCAKSQFCVMMYWAGLAHGREITGTPKVKNDSFDQGKMGFTVMLSGDPGGHTTEDSLHAYLMHGKYGGVKAFNLILYGKGERLNTGLLDLPDDVYGERGYGGSYVLPTPSITNNPAPIKLKNLTDPLFKIIAVDSVHQRAVAVTDNYFVDVYTAITNGTISLVYDGIGPTNSFATLNGTNYVLPNRSTTNGISVTWPNHQKMFLINEQTSTVTMTAKANLPNLVRQIYPSDPVMSLQVKRSGVVGYTRFISIIEPVGNGCSPNIQKVARFDTQRKNQVTSIKIDAGDYTDYVIYAHTNGAYTLSNGSENIVLDGAYGYIHYDKNTGAVTTKGGVLSYDITRAPLTAVSAPNITTPGTRLFENEAEVSISCGSPSSEVHYTLDGTDPRPDSPVYTTPFTLTNSATVRARAFSPGLAKSSMTSATFTKQSYVVASPTITPVVRDFATNLVVSLSVMPKDAVIRYTVDGSDPIATSPVYKGAVSLTKYTVLKARAFKPGWVTSALAIAVFTKKGETTKSPVIIAKKDIFNNRVIVTCTDDTAGASIYYTVDGSEPTALSALYSGPFELGPFPSDRSITVKACAIRPDWAPSAPTTTVLQVEGLSAPLVTFSGEAGTEGVLLRWVTPFENRNLGWNIYRKTNRDSAFVKINDQLVPGSGTTAEPRSYEYVDFSLPQGVTSVSYYLQQVDSQQRFQNSDSIAIVVEFVSVRLTSLTSEPTTEGVMLTWSTLFENDNLGWNIYRKTDLDTSFVRINEQLVAGSVNSTEPRSYQYLDASVPVTASTVTYYLEQVDGSDRRQNSETTFVEVDNPSAPLVSFIADAQPWGVRLAWTTQFEIG
ncbi:MAG TPA: hypothetical protein DCE44_07275, partial [Verrucomicrobiales bacterium]|nr:hypothetical protein [Verrucomicrobiales bacterium]